MFAACSSEELADQSVVQQDVNGAPVNFSIYTPRNVTRAGLDSTITTKSLKEGTHKDAGFGIFAYYTAGEKYDIKATPNFMYNQQVKWNGSKWAYEPVKYWPNEFGNGAISDDIDYVTFFSYAPWVKVDPTTGYPDVTGVTDADELDLIQNKNITKLVKNTATGDPLVYYTVDIDPATSVDLLWGVAAKNDGTTSYYDPIYNGNQWQTMGVQVKPGFPFLNLVKPNDPVNNKINFNLRHALAKMKITIDYVADATLKPNTETGMGASAEIDTTKTRIYLRSVTLGGFATKGVLNLNNEKDSIPNWKAADGVSELDFTEVTFNDGRKDDKEGTTSGAASEENALLNDTLVENTAATVPVKVWKTDAAKSLGVWKEPKLLLKGDPSQNDGWFYVIPRNQETAVDLTVKYDVQTIDSMVAGKLADGATLGTIVEQVLTQTNIFGADDITSTKPMDIKAGYQYWIKIHIGMTSIKVDATVTPWKEPVKQATPTVPYNNDTQP